MFCRGGKAGQRSLHLAYEWFRRGGENLGSPRRGTPQVGGSMLPREGMRLLMSPQLAIPYRLELWHCSERLSDP